MEETNIDQIIEVLERIEKEELSEDPDIKNWLIQITQVEFQLIESFIVMFIENIKDPELTDNVIKVLRKLNYYQQEDVLPQILKENTFPEALVKYIANQDIPKISGDAFCLFTEIYAEENFANLITKDFIYSLFDGFDLIIMENDLNQLVKLITKLNWIEKLNKFVLEVFDSHKNSRKLVDYLLFILNKEKNDKESIFKICKLISDLLDITKSSLFYKNDLDSFISISVHTLETTYTDELRFHFLNILNKILRYKDYFESKYKLDILVEILENYKVSENVDDENKQLCEQILESIEKNQ